MAIITQQDMQALIYDPNKIQQIILNHTGVNQVNDPTNPFVMLIEAAATLAAANAIETTTTAKRILPSLATETLDLLPHVTELDLPNLFSYPSEASIVFYINLMDMRNYGVRPINQSYVETVIPTNTSVLVAGVPFLLSNDILVRLYDNGGVFAEQQNSTEYSGNNSLSILAAGVVNFQDTVPWVAVESVLKQFNKSEIIKPITASEGFSLSVTHKDKYHYTEAYFRNASTNNAWVKIAVSHSDIYIDPVTPTLTASVMDNIVKYIIPDVYLVSGQISGELRIVLYETVGNLELPIYKYQMSEYAVTVGVSTATPVTASITNMSIFANSRDNVNGGTSGYTFQELKDSVINNTLGRVNMPITFDQLKKSVSVLGFELFPAADTITDRLYIASRNFDKSVSELVYTKPDLFFNTVNIDGTALSTTPVIKNTEYAIIPSGTLFRVTNGLSTVVPDTEAAAIKALPNAELITYLATNDIYYNLYYYIMDLTTTASGTCRIYDLDTPIINSIKITAKNVNVVERVNVGKYGVFKVDTGYQLKFTVISNAEFKNTNFNLLKGQLAISMFGGADTVYFSGTYDAATEMMTFDLNSGFNVTPNNEVEFTNGISKLTTSLVSLATDMTIHLFTEDKNVTDPTNYLTNEVVVSTNTTTNRLVVLDREVINVTLGRSVTTLWNKEYITYTNRRYQKYTADKPLVYKHDVYATDSLTGSIITVKTIAGVKTATKTILHATGTPVLDANGTPVLEYKQGDTMLAAGVPIPDNTYGVIRHLDILMLEYHYLAATGVVAGNYRVGIKDAVDGWLFNNLPIINNKTLENTKVLLRSYKKSVPVTARINSTVNTIPFRVIPQVDVYSTKKNYTGMELNTMQTTIGYIIHQNLDLLTVSFNDIKNEIISAIDNNIVTVKISRIEPTDSSEMFTINDPTRRLTMGKKLVINEANELIVEYDINLRVHSV